MTITETLDRLDQLSETLDRFEFSLELDGEYSDLSRQVRALIAENERMREALVSSHKSDKTPDYEYGQANRNGEKPGVGKRWLTPKEIARAILEDK